MTTTEEIHVGDIGTQFTLTISDAGKAVDLSSATTKQIIFRKPDAVKLTKTAEFVTDGTNGQVKYLSISGDLDLAGFWRVQAHVVLPTGEWSSSVEMFEVVDNL